MALTVDQVKKLFVKIDPAYARLLANVCRNEEECIKKGKEVGLQPNSNSFQNGRQRAEQEIANKMGGRFQNAVRSGLVQKGKTLIYKGREMDVIKVEGDMITLEDDGNRYKVNANSNMIEPGTTGD